MTAAGRESAVAEALAAHPTPSRCIAGADGLYRLECICGLQLAVAADPWGAHREHQAAAVLAALDQPAPGADERAALEALVSRHAGEPHGCLSPELHGYGCHQCWAQEINAILTARAHQPTPPDDWPCDWPTPHPSHVAESWDDLGRLIGYTEFCHGGNPTAHQPTPPAQAEAVATVERVRALVAKHKPLLDRIAENEERVAFIGGPEQAARFVASVAWPLERQENRDSWAPRLLAEPDMLNQEGWRARARLQAAIDVCRAAHSPADTGEGE